MSKKDTWVVVNKETVDLVKRWEGKRNKAYHDSVGVLTIGYGYTNGAGFGPGVKIGDHWSDDMCERMLREGLRRFGAEIITGMTRKPTPAQFGAMLSLAYNIGAPAFLRSTCLKRFNAGDMEGAAEALTWFNKADGRVLRGLVNRREAERDMFLGGYRDTANVEPDEPKTPMTSTTNIATVVAGTSAAASASEDVNVIVENFGLNPDIVFLVIILGALGWIFRERLLKLARGI